MIAAMVASGTKGASCIENCQYDFQMFSRQEENRNQMVISWGPVKALDFGRRKENSELISDVWDMRIMW